MNRSGSIALAAALLSLAAAIPTPSPGRSTSAPPVPVVLPPLPPSPVASFRRLLKLSLEEQDRLLAQKPESQRRQLEAKLREYRALPPGECELRLDATELRWYLRPLMNTPPTNRPVQLAHVPTAMRPLVEERILQWDRLDDTTRQDILQNEAAIRYVESVRSTVPGQTNEVQPALPPLQRRALDQEMARWQALPAERRERVCRQFQQFFELPDRQKAKALETFPDVERRQMQTTLDAFSKLPPAQRRVCVASFRKFAELAPAERAEFLKSADRWKAMTPAERDTWRKLVLKLPPLPPGLGEPPLPPIPRRGTASLPPAPPVP